MVATREPSCRAGQAAAFRSAALTLWGKLGWEEVLRAISSETREQLFEPPVSPVAWVPERLMMDLAEQVYEGPAARNDHGYRVFVRTMIEHGFGRIRRLFIRYATPELLLSRAPELWKHDHTHGELSVQIGDGRATAVLRRHPHVATELARLTAAETFKSALSLTRAREVQMEHFHDEDALRVELGWRR